MFKYFLFISLLLPMASFAETQMGSFVKEVQEKLVSKDLTPYPILIFDRDEMEWRFLKGHAVDVEKRKELIKKYVFEKTQTVIDDNDAGNVEIFLNTLKDSAAALPLRDAFASSFRLCAVFPASANSNERLEMERILGMNNPDVYGPIRYEHLKQKMNLDELRVFSLYHEVGHCLDQTFLPAMYSGNTDAHDSHLSESFAETFALLALGREGKTNLGERRANIRTLYSEKVGSYLVAHPENGPGDANYVYGGVIYYLTPALEAAQKYIEANPESIKKMSTRALLDLAKTIVQNEAMTSRLFSAIYQTYSDGDEAVLLRYKEYAEDHPQLFLQTYESLQKFFKRKKSNINAMIDLSRAEMIATQKLNAIEKHKLCVAVDKNDSNQFFTIIEDLRSDLKAKNASLNDQRERQKSLLYLREELSQTCP